MMPKRSQKKIENGRFLEKAEALAAQGNRVLGFAYKPGDGEIWQRNR